MILPSPNLPPLSQPWANKLPEIISSTDGIIKNSQALNKANQISQAATLDLLSRRIEELAIQAASVPLVAHLPVLLASSGAVVGTGISNFSTIKSYTIDFPETKTIADVFVFGSVRAPFGGTFESRVRVGINGSYDLPGTLSQYGVRNGGVSCARSGLTGPSFTVDVQVATNVGVSFPNSTTNLTIMVVFK